MKRSFAVALLFVAAVAPGAVSAKVTPGKTIAEIFVRRPCVTLAAGPCSAQPVTTSKSAADAGDKNRRRR